METKFSMIPEIDRRRRLSFSGTVMKTSTIVSVIATAMFLCILCGLSTVRLSALVNKDLGIHDPGNKFPLTRPVTVPNVTGFNYTWVASKKRQTRRMEISALKKQLWLNSRQIDYDGYSDVKMGKQMVVRDKWNNISSYFPYNLDDYGGFKQADSVVRGTTGFTDSRKLRLELYNSPFYGHMQYTPVASSTAFMISKPLRTKYRPPRIPAKIRPRPLPHQTVVKNIFVPVPKTNEIDWNILSILALVKLGLIKLKVFGVLKTMFVALFNFKLFLATLFYKAVLILKLTKFLKTKILFLFVLSLLPILIMGALFSIPGRLQQLLPSLTNALAAQQGLPSQPANALPTNRPAKFSRKFDSSPSVSAVSGSWLPANQPFHLPHIQSITKLND